MLGSATQTLIGRPVLPDATVHAIVEEHVRVDTYYFLFFSLWSQKVSH